MACFGIIGVFLSQEVPSLGLRIASLLAYSYLIFYYSFCDSKSLRGYSLRKEGVRRELPRLSGIHLLFLVLFFALHAIAWQVQQHLPSSWLADRGREASPFGVVVFLVFAIHLFTQLYISRKILSRVGPVEVKPD